MKKLFMILLQERYHDGTVVGIFDSKDEALKSAERYANIELEEDDTDESGFIRYIEVFETVLNPKPFRLGEIPMPIEVFGYKK